MELGWGRVGVGSAFLLRLPRFLKVSGTRFQAVAGNRYVLPVTLLSRNTPHSVVNMLS